MAKREEKQKKHDNPFVSVLKELTANVLLGSLKTIYENFLKTLQDYAYKTQKKVLDVFLTFFIFIIGIFIILLSIIFLIHEYLRFSFGWSLLVVGLFLLIMSLLMKSRIDKKK